MMAGGRGTCTECATEGKPFCCASKMAMPVGFMPRRVMQMDELQIQPCHMHVLIILSD